MKKNLRNTFMLVTIVIMTMVCLMFNASAKTIPSSGYCGDNVKYTYNSKTKELVISGKGDMYLSSDTFSHSDVKKVVIKSGVTSIGRSAFVGCEDLVEVVIPEGVKDIGRYAFGNCVSLKKADIPASATAFDFRIFEGCTSLEKINIHPNNPSYRNDVYGVAYTRQSKTLSKFPAGSKVTSYVVEDGTKTIDVEAFSHSKSLKAVALPESATLIAKGAFVDCGNLESIIINKNVRSVVQGAFNNCNKLKDVYYTGSKAQWQSISIDSTGTAPLTSAKIHYNHNAGKIMKPAKVTAESTTSTITLNWTAVAGASVYRIYYKTADGWKVVCKETLATSHTLKNYKAGVKYTFAVRPAEKTKDGTVWGSYTTVVAATKPATVTAKAVSDSKGKITVSWNKVNGAEFYQLYYKKADGSYKLYKTYDSAKKITFKNLKSGTKYTFAVRAGIKTSGGNVRGSYVASTVKVK